MSEDELYRVLDKSDFFRKLGYVKFGVDVRPQYPIPGERKKPDYLCRDDYQNVIFVIEAKKPSDRKLEDALSQLWERYVLPLKAKYGVLTNGRRLIVYQRTGLNHERLIDAEFEKISESQCNLIYRTLRKPEYKITDIAMVQQFFASIEKLSLKTDLARENFYETFKLHEDSVFGLLVGRLASLFDWIYPRSKFLKGAYGFWRKSLAAEPQKIPDSWQPFLKKDKDVFKLMFCLETAHALLARLILAKACEDLQFPDISVSRYTSEKIDHVRGRIPIVAYPIVLTKLLKKMEAQLVTSVFEEDIFSWWTDALNHLTDRSPGELLHERLDPALEDFSETIAKLVFILYKFDFGQVAGDPLGDLYQKYFDKDTRKALGEFYTPVEVANYILDAVQYRNVRYKRLLDPACGSGTFLVEALRRYLKEAEPTAKQYGWGQILRELCNSPRIVGLDIHPFACLIAQVRFMLELIPYYKRAIEEDREFLLLRLPIFRTDSLLIEMVPQELPEAPRLVMTTEDIKFTAALPVRVNSEKSTSVDLIIPSWTKAQSTTKYAFLNLDEYFCAAQGMFDSIKEMARVEAQEVLTITLKNHLMKYLSKKDFQLLAELLKPYADHILEQAKNLQSQFQDGRLIKSIEDAVLAALLKNYLQGNFGFDFVVGNPPYVRVQRLPGDLKRYYSEYYSSAKGKFDLFVLFIERGVKWLNGSGKLGYICSNQFLTRQYGTELKKLLLRSCSIKQIIDFGDSGVFRDVTNYPCILVLAKSRVDKNVFVYVRVADRKVDEKGEDVTLHHIRKNIERIGFSDDKIDVFNVKQIALAEDAWELMPEEENKVFVKIKNNRTCLLKDLVDNIYEGFITGANSVYFVNEDKVMKYGFERQLLKPVPKGKDVRRWQISWDGNYVIYPHEKKGSNVIHIDLEYYPKTKDYLSVNRKKLEERHYVIKSGKKWFEIWNPRSPDWFDRPKIVTPNLSTENSFAYDEGIMVLGKKSYYYLDHDCYGILLSSMNRTDHLYLLGILNSKVLEFYIKHLSPYCAGKYFRYMTGYLEQLPIKLPKTTEEERVAEQITQKVEEILLRIAPEQLVKDFPKAYLDVYRSEIELDEITCSFNEDHGELKPMMTGQPGKGYAIYPHKGEDPILVETEQKAQYLVLALGGKSSKRNDIIKIPIPRDNSIVTRILNDFKTKLKILERISTDQLEKEIDDLVCQLYGLNEQDKEIVESFFKKF